MGISKERIIHTALEGLFILSCGAIGGAAYKILSEGQTVIVPPQPTPDTSHSLVLKPSEEVLIPPKTAILAERAIRDYLSAVWSFEYILSEVVGINEERLGSIATMRDPINQAARQHLINGVYLLKTILPPEKSLAFSVDETSTQIAYQNRIFDINNSFHFHLLAGVVKANLNSQFMEFNKQTEKALPSAYRPATPGIQLSPEDEQLLQEFMAKENQEIEQIYQDQQNEIQEKIYDLLWLLDKNPNTVIEKDAFALLPSEYLVNQSRMFQALEKAGLPFPKRISYIRHTKDAGAAGYCDHNADDRAFTIVITNKSSVGSIFHETGHFLSDATFLDPSDPRLAAISQASFEQTIAGNPNLGGDKTLDPVERYATAFGDYFARGAEFRKQLAKPQAFYPYLSLGAFSPEEYEFMKRVFNGLEFAQRDKLWK